MNFCCDNELFSVKKPGYFDSTAASGNCQGTGGGDGECKLIEAAVAVVEILLRANGDVIVCHFHHIHMGWAAKRTLATLHPLYIYSYACIILLSQRGGGESTELQMIR